MILKQIYSKNLDALKNSLDKKKLVKDLYGKVLTRSSIGENLSLFVVDDNKSFFNISSSIENKVGSSIYAKEFEYKNKLNSSLTLKTLLTNNKSVKTVSFLSSFYNLLKTTEKDYRGSLLILNPIKGGFLCYSGGVVGFMPRRHATFSFFTAYSSIINSRSRNKQISVLNLSFLLETKNFIKNKFILRLSNWWGKITLFPRSRRNRFSNPPRRKKRKFSNRTNFVFLSKKNNNKKVQTKKLHENKKRT